MGQAQALLKKRREEKTRRSQGDSAVETPRSGQDGEGDRDANSSGDPSGSTSFDRETGGTDGPRSGRSRPGGGAADAAAGVMSPFPLTPCGKVGLANMGNSCYMNACVQLLLGCPEFREKVLVLESHSDPLVRALSGLSNDVASAEDEGGGVVFPADLYSVVTSSASDNFRADEQHDAQEFLSFLLDRLGEAAPVVSGMPGDPAHLGLPPPPERRGSWRSLGFPLQQAPAPPVPRSWVDELFEGEMSVTTRCETCANVTCTTERFKHVSLDVEDRASISHSLRSLAAPEQLGDGHQYMCDACRGLRNAAREARVSRAPLYLLLHLKRFRADRSGGAAKRSCRVPFPQQLALVEDLTTPEVGAGPVPTYELAGVIVHEGSALASGHYVAFVKDVADGGQWVSYDDEQVELVTEREYRSSFGSTHARYHSDAYLIMYRKLR